MLLIARFMSWIEGAKEVNMSSHRRTHPTVAAITDAIKTVADAVHDAPAEGSHINVARRTNIKVAKNVGRDSGTVHASATQVAPIIQHNGEKSVEGTNDESAKK
jgi:hypothetical protein